MVEAARENRLYLSVLSLFASLGTLVCCALPSLFVLLGLGATLASLLSSAPWLVRENCPRRAKGVPLDSIPNYRPYIWTEGGAET